MDAYNYFTIVLGGFGLVWSFRKGYKSQNQISDFEYLGFSSFWGVITLIIYQKIIDSFGTLKFNEVIQNPYATGTAFFLYSIVIGYFTGEALRWAQKKIKELK